MALLHHMTYPAAYEAFAEVAVEDPGCALAYWGMAMSLFQPLWPNRPGPGDLEQGWRLVREGRGRATGDARERGFLDAAAAFFDPSGEPDYWTRIERWAEAQAALLVEFPDDVEARAFFALSHLATASRGKGAGAHHARAAEVLGDILRVNPTHPGAVHYTIHANDFDGRQAESLGVVRRYGEIAPRNPHALHMPTHIFVRLGLWDEVIAWNRRAAEAALEQPVGPNGAHVWDEYPHAVEYLVYAYLQRGDDESARAAIDALHGTADLQPTFKTAFHLASTHARYALERRDWEAAARLPARTPDYLDWDEFWWPEAVVWQARAIGAARLGNPAAAESSVRRIDRLEASASAAGEEYFAAQIRILRLAASGWRQFAIGDTARALGLMEEASRLEEATPKHPVTPGASIPAREMLADMLLESGRPALALAQYRRVDARTPGRFQAILGLARAAAASGRSEEAADHYRRLLELAVAGSERKALLEARAYLAENGPA